MMSSGVKESIEILKQAQNLDRELYLAEQQLKTMPEEKERLQQELDHEKKHLLQMEEELKKIQLKQKEKEKDLAQKEANIKKFEGQLSQVKTNKEYTALQQEIASLKADNSLLEEEIIKALDSVDAAEDEVRKEKERLKQVEKESHARQNELGQKEKTLHEAIENLKKTREEIIKQVASDARSLYDLIISKKQGLALVKVNGEICGACRLQLRPQLINEIRLGQSLIVCENCSRILYFED